MGIKGTGQAGQAYMMWVMRLVHRSTSEPRMQIIGLEFIKLF